MIASNFLGKIKNRECQCHVRLSASKSLKKGEKKIWLLTAASLLLLLLS